MSSTVKNRGTFDANDMARSQAEPRICSSIDPYGERESLHSQEPAIDLRPYTTRLCGFALGRDSNTGSEHQIRRCTVVVQNVKSIALEA